MSFYGISPHSAWSVLGAQYVLNRQNGEEPVAGMETLLPSAVTEPVVDALITQKPLVPLPVLSIHFFSHFACATYRAEFSAAAGVSTV